MPNQALTKLAPPVGSAHLHFAAGDYTVSYSISRCAFLNAPAGYFPKT